MKEEMILEAGKIEQENAHLKEERDELRVMYEQKVREC